jgi:dTDP-4-dehydrorhamnose reductase
LGSELQIALRADSNDVVKNGYRADADLADAAGLEQLVSDFGPDVVINAAAYTAVDAAEDDEDAAYRINGSGVARLALAVERQGGRLIHVSTDYVFAGDARSPYEVGDPTEPKSAYGRTKLAGEQAVREILPDRGYVVRTAWLYSAFGNNFVKTMARLERERETVTVVDDQLGSPTWAADLAHALIALCRSAAPAATLHCTNTDQTSWYEFARAIFSELGADAARVLPVSTSHLKRSAPRPSYSVLSDASWVAAGLPRMRSWRAALAAAFAAHPAELRSSSPQPDSAS